MTDDSVAKLAKAMVVVITGLAMYLALYSSTTLVGLLLFAYSGIAQFFPGVILGLYWKRANAAGVLAGIIAGVGTGMVLTFTKHDPVGGLNAGFVALCVNLAITAAVSRMTAAQPNRFEEEVEIAVTT